MTTAKTKIIQFLEAQGEQSTGKIEDYMRVEFGTLGGTTGRRLRELVASGVCAKTARSYEGKKYFSYRVSKEDMPGFEGTWNALEVLTQNKLI